MPHVRLPLLPESARNADPNVPLAPFRDEMEAAGSVVIGFGAESIVEVLPSDHTKVAAHSFRDNPDKRLTYYNHKILHTLFPNHFPVIHAAFEGDHNGMGGGTIRERIYPQEPTSQDRVRGLLGRITLRQDKRSFQYVVSELNSIGIACIVDPSSWNFMRGRDGYEKYLDTAPSIDYEFAEREEELYAYAKKRRYSDEDRRAIATSMTRLKVLREQKS